LELVHLRDLTDEQWHNVHSLMFDPRMAEHTGVSPELIAAKPDLVTFYRNLMMAHKADRFEAWAIMRNDKFYGYTLLDKSAWGEWELGTILTDPDNWGSGVGAKAGLLAMKWAFEKDNSEWVLAFVQNRDPKVRPMLIKAGFRPLSHALVMDKPTWERKWAGRI
jgi:RimJ/RimL family protein N-acetyltransferase